MSDKDRRKKDGQDRNKKNQARREVEAYPDIKRERSTQAHVAEKQSHDEIGKEPARPAPVNRRSPTCADGGQLPPPRKVSPHAIEDPSPTRRLRRARCSRRGSPGSPARGRVPSPGRGRRSARDRGRRSTRGAAGSGRCARASRARPPCRRGLGPPWSPEDSREAPKNLTRRVVDTLSNS